MTVTITSVLATKKSLTKDVFRQMRRELNVGCYHHRCESNGFVVAAENAAGYHTTKSSRNIIKRFGTFPVRQQQQQQQQKQSTLNFVSNPIGGRRQLSTTVAAAITTVHIDEAKTQAEAVAISRNSMMMLSAMALLMMTGTAGAATTTDTTCRCESNIPPPHHHHHTSQQDDSTTGTSTKLTAVLVATSATTNTPASVATEDLEELVEKSNDNMDTMPIYTAEQVAVNDGTDGKPVWMSYGGIVYDVTDFIANHPGGASKIMLAAGSHIEPFWYLYRQHFNSDLPMRLMEHMAIGKLNEDDQNDIDDQLATLEQDDPYAKEPVRHSALLIHGDTPMNAEVPTKLLTESYLTPVSLFYIRHHHPVPFLTDKQIQNYTIDIDLSECGGPKNFQLTIDELKQMEKVEIDVTLQCSGNRRSGFNYHGRTSGTPWGQGAISTAKFGGVRLRDLLAKAGVSDPILVQEKLGMNHVQFQSIDGMETSIDIEKALNPYGDCIVAYEMNDEILTREHGYPLRVIVPGYSGIRNVKWLKKITLSAEDSDSPFNRGINYKLLPPSVKDANNIDLKTMPSVNESSVFSGITKIDHVDESGELVSSNNAKVFPGDIVYVKASGWAWAGGGRNIVRVNLTGDEGRSWTTATLGEGSKQRHGRAWAWTFWSCIVPVKVKEDGTVHIAASAVDSSFNIQPESCKALWNFRGLCNNSWYRAHIRVV